MKIQLLGKIVKVRAIVYDAHSDIHTFQNEETGQVGSFFNRNGELFHIHTGEHIGHIEDYEDDEEEELV